ncbi:MAG: molybdopterin-dependent oxidoreductase [Proteobacteria bacterium]|nr:molybdopterin-dependent oxidoreductase [Pseudomonadota bacterium]
MGVVIQGEVTLPAELDYFALAALPGQVAELGGVVEGRAGQAVRLAALLESAGVSEGVDWITFESDDGEFAISVHLDAVADAVLAYSLDGESLPREQGGPVRLYVANAAKCTSASPDECANVKSVTTITLARERGRDTRPKTPREHEALHSDQ